MPRFPLFRPLGALDTHDARPGHSACVRRSTSLTSRSYSAGVRVCGALVFNERETEVVGMAPYSESLFYPQGTYTIPRRSPCWKHHDDMTIDYSYFSDLQCKMGLLTHATYPVDRRPRSRSFDWWALLPTDF